MSRRRTSKGTHNEYEVHLVPAEPGSVSRAAAKRWQAERDMWDDLAFALAQGTRTEEDREAHARLLNDLQALDWAAREALAGGTVHLRTEDPSGASTDARCIALLIASALRGDVTPVEPVALLAERMVALMAEGSQVPEKAA